MTDTQSRRNIAADDRLLRAVERGDLVQCRAALAEGASPNAIAAAQDERTWAKAPALYVACKQGHAAIVELLLAEGADPDARFTRQGPLDLEGIPCLIAALPDVAIVAMLLNAGADPNLPSYWGEDCTTERSPLAHAAGNSQATALLSSYGARS
jgi:hypothetical protein